MRSLSQANEIQPGAHPASEQGLGTPHPDAPSQEQNRETGGAIGRPSPRSLNSCLLSKRRRFAPRRVG